MLYQLFFSPIIDIDKEYDNNTIGTGPGDMTIARELAAI
jgi:hypothetical protein